ncbi:SHAN3 protein, partial [Leucopsar rothschildi]|nr:SHAN3 protein [Leucopsar rothschildi]
ECPLTAAAQLELSTDMIKALRNGGAHLDFRTREGMTALHKAVRCRNHAALLVRLVSGNVLLVPTDGDPPCGAGSTGMGSEGIGNDPLVFMDGDPQGLGMFSWYQWQEIHQACRYGHVQHLEHLLFYGADMTAQNASGNTALHICAL